MPDLDISLTELELIDEVRNALAGLDGSMVPDGTITQTANRLVVPLVNDVAGNITEEDDQDAFDAAVIAWTAELSFGAWLTFSRLRDREVEAYVDPRQYKVNLAERTNLSLQLLGASRPPEIPNHVVTIKHDGVDRTVDLRRVWEYE